MTGTGTGIVIIAIALLSIAMAGVILVKYLKIPYVSMPVLLGLAIGLFHAFPQVKITPAIIYYIFLALLIMEGALKFSIKDLKDNVLPISVYAVIGTIISALLVGLGLHFLLFFPMKQSLVFGAIISPTDPLSIIAFFKTLARDKSPSPLPRRKRRKGNKNLYRGFIFSDSSGNIFRSFHYQVQGFLLKERKSRRPSRIRFVPRWKIL